MSPYIQRHLAAALALRPSDIIHPANARTTTPSASTIDIRAGGAGTRAPFSRRSGRGISVMNVELRTLGGGIGVEL